MNNKLSKIFDFQKFEKNAHLEKIIKDINNKYCLGDGSVSDDDLDSVCAAGEVVLLLLEDEDDEKQ